MTLRIFLFHLTLFYSLPNFGQEEQLIEQLELINPDFYNQLSENDLDELTQYYLWVTENPYNLNTVTRIELERLGIFTSRQISIILNYRIQFGNLKSVYELRNLISISNNLSGVLLRVFKVEEPVPTLPFSFRKNLARARKELLFQSDRVIQPVEGNLNRDYFGNPWRQLLKVRIRQGADLSCGLLIEKDAGEKGLDFYSGHFQFRNQGFFKQLIIGDYSLKIGAGLSIWNGFNSMGNTSRSTINQALSSPYTSRNEWDYLRGLSIITSLKKFTLLSFASYKSIDAHIHMGQDDDSYFQSQNISGHHRTPTESIRKKAVKHMVIGSNLSWENRNFRMGSTTLFQDYSTPYSPFPKKEKSISKISQGIDFKVLLNKIEFWGEASVLIHQGHGFYLGANHNQDQFHLTFNVYHYSAGYNNLLSKPLFRLNKNENENGINVAIDVVLKNNISLNLFNAINYSYGSEIQPNSISKKSIHSFRIIFPIKNETNLTLQGKSTWNEDKITLNKSNRFSLRVHLNYAISSNTQIKVRYQNLISFPSRKTIGSLIYAEISKNWKLAKFSFRYTLFDTDSYDSRIYALEKGVLHQFSSIPFYNMGSRINIVWTFKFNQHLSAWIKLGHTNYHNRTTTGSGLQRINSSKKTDVNVQLRFRI